MGALTAFTAAFAPKIIDQLGLSWHNPYSNLMDEIRDVSKAAGHDLSYKTRLEFDHRYMKESDHSDNIRIPLFAFNQKVAWGEGLYGRRFYAFRILWNPKSDPSSKKLEALTIFEKYSTKNSICVASSEIQIFKDITGRNGRLHSDIKKLLNGEECTFSHNGQDCVARLSDG